MHLNIKFRKKITIKFSFKNLFKNSNKKPKKLKSFFEFIKVSTINLIRNVILQTTRERNSIIYVVEDIRVHRNNNVKEREVTVSNST